MPEDVLKSPTLPFAAEFRWILPFAPLLAVILRRLAAGTLLVPDVIAAWFEER